MEIGEREAKMKDKWNTIKTELTQQWREKLGCTAVFVLSLVYLELAIHLAVFGSVWGRLIWPALFAAAAGAVLYGVASLFPERAGKWVGLGLVAAVVLCFEVQLVYHCVFGSFMPIYQITMGAAAVTNFSGQVLHAITHNLGKVIALLLPLPALAAVLFKPLIPLHRAKPAQSLLALLTAVCLFLAAVGGMRLAGTGEGSAYDVLTNDNASTESSVKSLGLLATAVQEVRGLVRADSGTRQPLPESSALTGGAAPEESTGGVNALDLDFTALAAEDPELQALNRYLAACAPTPKNEYTGLAEGYNLITICAESFSPLVIDAELTPTLYHLSTNGFRFQNFYNSFVNTTTNGEFAFCTGLLPNMSRTKVDSSFDACNSNYLPYCLGNVFRALGGTSNAYHNYYGSFYNRTVSHVNMGYDFKAIGAGLEMEVAWPSSDLTMMELSAAEYLKGETPFHAYYMTFSGHYQYSWENAMSAKNRAAVEHLPYSETVKAYLACNLELEYALRHLMEELEAAGQAERTVIVLTGDHYPYGLTEAEYNELAGEPVDTTFERFRNSFICYVPGMEPVVVEEYCSTVDILPTLLNLLGVSYDSRLLAGRDVLAEGVHLALLSDRSFLTEDFRFDASSGAVTDHSGQPVEAAQAADYRAYVDGLFAFSEAVIDTDYYSCLFGGESVFKEQPIQDFTDVTDVYTEAAILFAVNSGYLEPDSPSVFGTERTPAASELIEALYVMAGRPPVEGNTQQTHALAWALEIGVTEDPAVWDAELTYGKTAELTYGYCRAFKEAQPPDGAAIAELCVTYPDLAEDEITAMKWCEDAGIIRGPGGDKTVYDRYGRTVNRGQLAAYLQRIYQYGKGE